MPVGSRSKVWTSHSCSNFRRTVSPAPPSKRTLSGTTTAARPLISSSVLTCCTKFNCLLLVDAQKSSRTIVVDSRLTSPSSVTNVTLDFLPNGGLVSTILKRLPARVGSEAVIHVDRTGTAVRTNAMQVQVHHA